MSDQDIQARNRYFVMVALRITGAVMVILGLMFVLGRFGEVSPIVGYALIGIGLLDVAVMPTILARRWRTPPRA